ncbi:hypothetical protein EV140_1939 [Microcella alkaliphila]|uniref:Uncharacterized protein n=1 Tax=Microcella alkaliphila TaxID=279828 RepID=A0A4Q7TFT8_9MICO|nr:hypothetical protein [Microcella alkaliphila]RZT59334.1 hypothetical protein EV140_1939 [Microcella alkaliphila]
MNRPTISENVPTCVECGVERPKQAKDYNPMQAIIGAELGWYSGSDGELCGPCLSALMRMANGR